MSTEHAGLVVRPGAVNDAAALDHALVGAAALINCAGPFASTVASLIDAALRARLPCLDVAAEIEANLDTFANHADRARDAGTIVLPARAFYGGLGDLLATAAMGDWPGADEILIAYGLSTWRTTPGTRGLGRVSRERRGGKRIVFSNGALEHRADTAPTAEWTFPSPLGTRQVASEFTMADTVTISRHFRTPEIRSFMTLSAVGDVSDPTLPPPSPIDKSGRSAQTFVVEVVARRGNAERRAAASGRNIYAVTAPLVVEATERILRGEVGAVAVLTAGEAFDARDVLGVLCPETLSVEFSHSESAVDSKPMDTN